MHEFNPPKAKICKHARKKYDYYRLFHINCITLVKTLLSDRAAERVTEME